MRVHKLSYRLNNTQNNNLEYMTTLTSFKILVICFVTMDHEVSSIFKTKLTILDFVMIK